MSMAVVFMHAITSHKKYIKPNMKSSNQIWTVSCSATHALSFPTRATFSLHVFGDIEIIFLLCITLVCLTLNGWNFRHFVLRQQQLTASQWIDYNGVKHETTNKLVYQRRWLRNNYYQNLFIHAIRVVLIGGQSSIHSRKIPVSFTKSSPAKTRQTIFTSLGGFK